MALIAARRDFFEQVVIADYDLSRAQQLVERLDILDSLRPKSTLRSLSPLLNWRERLQ